MLQYAVPVPDVFLSQEASLLACPEKEHSQAVLGHLARLRQAVSQRAALEEAHVAPGRAVQELEEAQVPRIRGPLLPGGSDDSGIFHNLDRRTCRVLLHVAGMTMTVLLHLVAP